MDVSIKDRPTISLESKTESDHDETYFRAVWNPPRGTDQPRLFGPWMKSVNGALMMLARDIGNDSDLAGALLRGLVVVGNNPP